MLREFPDWPPYGGAFDTIVPYLTAADGDADAAPGVAAEPRAACAARPGARAAAKSNCSTIATVAPWPVALGPASNGA
ncbi:MAG: hypothetical protein MZW92_66265 [Comamonadaceae bacterium]|nr:hypothetical protein [Comamonadaceae bacterium]